MNPEIVIDTNVFVAALRSRNGASFRLLSLVGGKKFGLNISVPLILEYEDAAKRSLGQLTLTEDDIDDILNYVCRVAGHRKIYYLWRPFLRDPKDDLVLELAVTSNSQYIVTYNKDDLAGVEENFGIRIVTPKEFLLEIGEIK
jgi:putative PIN family toxin of toxin-antitoxin system